MEAPASNARLPATINFGKSSRAPANLWPPLETKSSRSVSTVIEVSASTWVAGLVAGIPPTRTDLASIKSVASSRERQTASYQFGIKART